MTPYGSVRGLLCRWFRLLPVEEVEAARAYQRATQEAQEAQEAQGSPSSWSDLWEYKDIRPVFPRITLSPVWKSDIEPWFRQGLLFTLLKLTHETDPERVRMLQERAKLLHEWIETPRLAQARTDAALNNALGSGRADRLEAEMERANKGTQYAR